MTAKNKIDTAFLLNQEPKDAVKYLEDKGYKISWDWHDTLKESHAKAFSVAKMTKMDLLQDTHKMLNQAVKEGWSEREFEIKASEMYKKRGWWGKQKVENPKTGKLETVKLGSPYRLRTIFNTNIQCAYMAGRWKNAVESAQYLPNLEYICMNTDRSRPSHKALHGTILPVTHPFWAANLPPNAWHCKCITRSVTNKYAQANGGITDDKKLKNVAEERWDYNVGQAWVQPKLDEYDYKIAKDYCTGIVTGAPFEYFFNKAKKAASPEELIKSSMPVAVISEKSKKYLGTASQAVLLSNETLYKNINNHPEIKIDEYKTLPDLIDKAELITQEGENKIIYLKNDKYYNVAVIKTTKSKKENYLVSFFRTDEREVKRRIKKGKIIKNRSAFGTD